MGVGHGQMGGNPPTGGGPRPMPPVGGPGAPGQGVRPNIPPNTGSLFGAPVQDPLKK